MVLGEEIFWFSNVKIYYPQLLNIVANSSLKIICKNTSESFSCVIDVKVDITMC